SSSFTAGEASVSAASAAPISIVGGTKFSTTPISSDSSYSCETTAAFSRKRLLISVVWRGFNRGSESCRKLRKVQSRYTRCQKEGSTATNPCSVWSSKKPDSS